MTNKNTLKKLLATASTVAFLASGQGASAITTTGNAALSAQANWNTDAGVALGAVPDPAQNIIWGGAHQVTFDVAGYATGNLTTNGANLATAIISKNTSFGNIVANANGQMLVNFNGGTLSLTGTNYNTLGAPTAANLVFDFNNQATVSAILNFNADNTNFTGTIQNTGANAGANTALVNIAGNTTFTDVVMGAAKADNNTIAFNVADAKTLTLAGKTDLSQAGLTTLAGAAGLTLQAAAKTGAVAANTGAIAVVAGTTLGATTFAGAGNLTASGTSVSVATLGNVTFNAGGTAVIGDYVQGGGNITLTGDAKISLNGTNSTLTTVTFADAGSILNLTAGTVTTVAAGAAGNDIVNVSGTATIGQLGTNAAPVGSLNFTDNSVLTLGGANAGSVNIITTSAGKTAQIKLTGSQTVGQIKGDTPANTAFIFDAPNLVLKATYTDLAASVIGLSPTGNGAATLGQVVFNNAGNVIFTGSISGVNNISINGGAATNVDFTKGTLSSVGGITFDANIDGQQISIGSLGSISASNTYTYIDSSTGKAATLNFQNANDVIVSSLGHTEALTTVNLNGAGNVTVATKAGANQNNSGAAQITTLNFGTGAAGATFTSDSLTNITNITTASVSGGTVAFRIDSNVGNDLGTAANGLKALNFVGSAATTLDLGGKSINGANVLSSGTATNGIGLLTVTGAGKAGVDAIGYLGSSGNQIVKLTFTGSGAVANAHTVGMDSNGVSVYSQSTTLGAGAYVFKGGFSGVQVNGANAQLDGNGALVSLTFNDGAKLSNTDIVGVGAAGSSVNFLGGATVGKIGTAATPATALNFTGSGKTDSLNDSIYATNTALEANTYSVDGAKVSISGAQVITKGSTLALNTNSLTLGVVTTTGAITVSTKVTNATTYGTLTTTSIDSLANVNLSVSRDATLIASGTTLPGVIAGVGVGTNVAKLGSLTSANSAIQTYTAVANGANQIDLQVGQDFAGFKAALSAAGAKQDSLSFVDKLQGSTGTASQLLNLADELIIASPNKAVETLERVTAESNTLTHSSQTIAHTLDVTSQRLNKVSATGVSSGSEDSSMGLGVWGEVFGSKATQKATKGDSGFNANSSGGTIGVDTKVSDATTLGISVSQYGSNLKYKNTKSGDKTKSSNTFFNVYGRHDLYETWFVQGAVGFGSGKVKSHEKRVISATTYDVATAKYDSLAYSIDTAVGYSYKLADATDLVPTVGVRYLNINEGGYSETGSQYNRTVTKKATDKFTGIFGTSLKHSMDVSGSSAILEGHVFGNYDFVNKNPKVSAKIDGMTTSYDISPAKQNKFSWNLGLSVSAKTEMVEYGVGYDARLADKFTSHQGTLRLRVEL